MRDAGKLICFNELIGPVATLGKNVNNFLRLCKKSSQTAHCTYTPLKTLFFHFTGTKPGHKVKAEYQVACTQTHHSYCMGKAWYKSKWKLERKLEFIERTSYV